MWCRGRGLKLKKIAFLTKTPEKHHRPKTKTKSPRSPRCGHRTPEATVDPHPWSVYGSGFAIGHGRCAYTRRAASRSPPIFQGKQVVVVTGGHAAGARQSRDVLKQIPKLNESTRAQSSPRCASEAAGSQHAFWMLPQGRRCRGCSSLARPRLISCTGWWLLYRGRRSAQ